MCVKNTCVPVCLTGNFINLITKLPHFSQCSMYINKPHFLVQNNASVLQAVKNLVNSDYSLMHMCANSKVIVEGFSVLKFLPLGTKIIQVRKNLLSIW